MATIERQITFVDEKSQEKSDPCACRYDIFCHCSEDLNVHEWAWDKEAASPATLLSKQNREVRFHPGYSSGTAAIRGDSPFTKGNVYYWEIKMLTSLYGTDVMVGVGTKAAELHNSTHQFCSLLGSDKESYGFSYTGRRQHNGKSEWYGPPFGKGSVIGIYLDMWSGTLEFFLNRRPLGIAFRSLRNYILYPMVCSTAAQSAMRVTMSVSHPVSLKLLSLQALRSDREALNQLLAVPGNQGEQIQIAILVHPHTVVPILRSTPQLFQEAQMALITTEGREIGGFLSLVEGEEVVECRLFAGYQPCSLAWFQESDYPSE